MSSLSMATAAAGCVALDARCAAPLAAPMTRARTIDPRAEAILMGVLLADIARIVPQIRPGPRSARDSQPRLHRSHGFGSSRGVRGLQGSQTIGRLAARRA